MQRLKTEFAQALQESGRDPNLQMMSSNDFKAMILDRHYQLILSDEERQALTTVLGDEFSDKLKPLSLHSFS